MSAPRKVLIDGVEYAPVNVNAPGIKDLLAVLVEDWWGSGDGWQEYASSLRVIVTDSPEWADDGMSLTELAARLAKRTEAQA